LVDFPDEAHKSYKFLNERETRFIMDRVNRDRGDAKIVPFSASSFFRAGLDLKIWAYAMVWHAIGPSFRRTNVRQIFFNTTCVTYALAYFLPIILRENMGFSIGASQCLGEFPASLSTLKWC
jgi:hypothetical protein